MPNPHGTHIWYELMTTDPDAAGRFYADVVGWAAAPFGGEGAPGYTIFSTAETGVGGMMTLPAGAAEGGLRPGWLGYVGVDDVDAAVAAITAGGGTVHMPANDLPGVGRMALVTDPQGVLFYVMRGASESDSRAFDPRAIGHCAWHELATTDQAAALIFYGEQFGWRQSGSMPMGDLGDYVFLDHGGAPIGAVMTRQEAGPPPMWSYYFRVPDIDAAAARIAAGGGNVLHGPQEVPGGDHIVVAADPQGVMFHLVGAKA
ncbi:VOC family protein [Sphingomonas profundi]|uniref:VOC family protein n=1 Tax=Alterirhizorhabdus profundi TaxID=2681549 RepID=UPI0012E748E0|nr:VOC family protein [Sphingomonas profundi]